MTENQIKAMEQMDTIDKKLEELGTEGYMLAQELNFTSCYCTSLAIALFLNKDIKGACIGESYWFISQQNEYIYIATYTHNILENKAILRGMCEIPKDTWYQSIRPLLKEKIEAGEEIYGIATSGWYMDHQNKWHGPDVSIERLPEFKLYF